MPSGPAPPSPIDVLVVEDRPQVSRQLVRSLGTSGRLRVVGSVTTGHAAVEAVERLSPRVVLLDLGLPDLNGIRVTEQIKKARPGTEVLIFTVFDDEASVLEAIRAGASGYLLKGATADRIVDAITEVAEGGSVIQPSLARSLLRHFRGPVTQRPSQPPAAGLTERETEILQIIARGLSNADAARVLSISAATVRTHLEHIYQKLDVANRTEAVSEGIRQGIIEVSR